MRRNWTIILFACQSFAWFTSKDEVTNRLSAQADYGVSIVESFAPPAEWLPGQKVNKDVYATNTGNIAALVKEEIDTRIAITYEADAKDFSADCVELKGDERYAMEAGSFLAYRPSDSKYPISGYEIVTRPEDNANNLPKETDFTPDKQGLYVFRRSIKVTDATTGKEEFKYDGYYFVPKGTTIKDDDGNNVVLTEDKYYKVSNIQTYQDSHVDNNGQGGTWTFNDYMGDGINDDGTLMVASATFRKEIKDLVDPMDLTYLRISDEEVADENSQYYKMDEGQYLVASYDRGNNKTTADATAKAEAYDKAIHEYEHALALFNQASAEYTTAHDTNLANADKQLNGDPSNPTDNPGATKTLDDANKNHQNALATYNNKLTAYNNALDKLKEAKKAYEDSMTELYGGSKGSTAGYDDPSTTETDESGLTYSPSTDVSSGGYTADSLYGKYMKAKSDREADNIPDTYEYTDGTDITAEFTAYKAANPSTVTKNFYTELDTDGLKEFRNWVDKNTTGEKHNHFMLVIDELIAQTNYETERDKCLGATGTSYDNATPNTTLGAVYKDALDKYKTAYSELGDISKKTEYNGYVDGKVITAADTATTNSAAALALDNAKDSLKNAQDAYELAVKNYQEKLEESNAAEELKDAAEALKEAANDAKGKAETAYNTAKDSAKLKESDGAVKIYIKLNDDAVITDQTGNTSNEKWFLDPVTLDPTTWTGNSPHTAGDTKIQTGTLLNNKAVFYYTGLLEGGETSSKLVDYVLLDPKAKQGDYKNFDFDINVALNSAQINLDKDGNIQTDAAQSELAKFATYNNGTDTNDVNKVVTWSNSVTPPPAAAATTFIGTVGVKSVAVNPTGYNGADDLAAYKYQFTLSNADAVTLGVDEGIYLCETQVGTYKLLNSGAIDSTNAVTVAVG